MAPRLSDGWPPTFKECSAIIGTRTSKARTFGSQEAVVEIEPADGCANVERTADGVKLVIGAGYPGTFTECLHQKGAR